MTITDQDITEVLDGVPGDALARIARSRVLVTGANGFLGAWLMPVLRRVAKSVVGYDVRGNGSDIIECDVTKPLDAECDLIIHAAGIASPVHYRARPLDTIDVAVDGTRNMLELAKKNGARLLFTSSSEIYGDPQVVPTPEDYWGHVSCRGFRACYDESKRMGETLVAVYADQFALDTVTVRIFNFYGAGLSLEDYRVMSKFAGAMLEGKPLQVFGYGRQSRSYCFVSDGIAGILTALGNGEAGGIYNVGSDEAELSVASLAVLSRQVTGTFGSIEFVAPPDVYVEEPQRRCPVLDRIKALGYRPRVGIEEGLRRFYASFGIGAEKAAE
jgi:UDP-glucuronate decarboxylase